MKMQFPFRLGTSSYIIPDDILPNVRYLCDKVDDVELVLFESQGQSNLPDAQVIGQLRDIASAHDLTYTVHFPLDVYPGSRDRGQREQAVDTFVRIMEIAHDLDPFAYVLHLTPDLFGCVPSLDVPRWLDAMDESLSQLLSRTQVDPRMLCAETLSYPFDLVMPLVQEHDLAVTLDIGHIWLMGYDQQHACNTLLERTRICHLHGVSAPHAEGGTDHLGLGYGDQQAIESFVRQVGSTCIADGQQRVVTLEVFGEEPFENSMQVMRRFHDTIE